METNKKAIGHTLHAPEDREDFATWFCNLHGIEVPPDALKFKLNLLAQLREAGVRSTLFTKGAGPDYDELAKVIRENAGGQEWYTKIPDWVMVVLPLAALVAIYILLQFLQTIF